MSDEERAEKTDSQRLQEGEFVTINGKLYGVCDRCGCIVRIDKPILGALHICK
jgi:hypothetical protein